ncbi:ATP-dependent Clp protease adapter ClpS [Rubritalea marina]|uniref:ATP-dependent Clp protease adapter ClpS n=1 Tax=Rubritalea marina TaxID=361055 RepID=UPI001969DD58|nr:ATP-dependent Clp protease adapter ClpS [Rubritalea marina]
MMTTHMSSGSSETKTSSQTKTQKAPPWSVVVFDDPVNLQNYVTLVLQRVFGYNKSMAEKLMMEVHNNGLSHVWSGNKERAELFVQQLHGYQLKASIQQAK